MKTKRFCATPKVVLTCLWCVLLVWPTTAKAASTKHHLYKGTATIGMTDLTIGDQCIAVDAHFLDPFLESLESRTTAGKVEFFNAGEKITSFPKEIRVVIRGHISRCGRMNIMSPGSAEADSIMRSLRFRTRWILPGFEKEIEAKTTASPQIVLGPGFWKYAFSVPSESIPLDTHLQIVVASDVGHVEATVSGSLLGSDLFATTSIQTGAADYYDAKLVRSWVELPPSVLSGSTFLEKEIYRMGDRIAPSIAHGFTPQEIQNAARLPRILYIIRLAFSLPEYISHEQDKSPAVTRLLLSFLEHQCEDPELKKSIVETEDYVSAHVHHRDQPKPTR